MTSVLAHRHEAERLMVIVPDRLSDLISKGEITSRYYNPGELFKEVHLVLTNDDQPDLECVQNMVGSAQLKIYNRPTAKRLFLRTLGWRRFMLRSWLDDIVKLAREIKPQLVRCHGADLNALAAKRIKHRLGIPYVVSVHTNSQQNQVLLARSWIEKIYTRLLEKLASEGLRSADLAIAVYPSILPFLNQCGASRATVAYNVLSADIGIKKEYALGRPIRVISVGRQIPGKDPENLIRAVSRTPDTELTLIGSGSLHEKLIAIAREEGCLDRCIFIPAMPNKAICSTLAKYDLFAAHCIYWGMPKAVMEALLAGLPVIMNRRPDEPVNEWEGLALLVDDSVEGYEKGMRDLINDGERRRLLGSVAHDNAEARFGPHKSELAYVDIYRSILNAALS